MAESPEHRFLTDTSLSVLRGMAGSRLYGYREADRRKLDFACGLVRDWERRLSGQTMWSHIEGVDKDLRTLLSDEAADVCLYVARDSVKARNILHEALVDFRRSMDRSRPWRLRVIWVPGDFDADSDAGREAVETQLRHEITEDLLLNVVLDNLNREHVRLFVRSSGVIGLDFAVLYQLAFSPFVNLASLGKDLGVSSGSLRERLVRLLGCGFLDQPDPTGSYFIVTGRGRVFFELCREIVASNGAPSPELARILELLDLEPPPDPPDNPPSALTGVPHDALAARVIAARDEFGVELQRTDFYPYWSTVPPGTGMVSASARTR